MISLGFSQVFRSGSRLLLSGRISVQRKLSVNALVSEIPQNLFIEDASILKPVAPKVVIDDLRYLFPSLDAPSSIEVIKFESPGEKSSPAALEPEVFNVALRKDIVHEVIRHQRAAVRQPHKTKRIGEIRGSNKKPRPQKGTGSSQVGHRRNSAWRGGQKAHGPVLRDFSISLNRKVMAKGMMISLAAKLREGNLVVFDKLACPTHKTKELVSLLERHGLSEKSILVLDDEFDMNFLTASGNIPNVTTLRQLHASVYEIVKREKLIVSQAALEQLQSRLLAQFKHRGKLKGYLSEIANFEAVAKENCP